MTPISDTHWLFSAEREICFWKGDVGYELKPTDGFWSCFRRGIYGPFIISHFSSLFFYFIRSNALFMLLKFIYSSLRKKFKKILVKKHLIRVKNIMKWSIPIRLLLISFCEKRVRQDSFFLSISWFSYTNGVSSKPSNLFNQFVVF